MKAQIILIVSLLCTVGYAQSTSGIDISEEKTISVQKEGKLVKVTSFHENGTLAQEGYLKNNKLHGKWASYAANGDKLAMANYNKGKKEGTWLHWTNKGLVEVEYKSNRLVHKIKWAEASLVVDAN